MSYDFEFRRDPDEVLRQIKESQSEANDARGQLKIFFGYAAGVGKTYAMLEDAHLALSKGFDVVVAYVEPHLRPATTALLEGLEIMPLREIDYKGMTLRELDLDAILERRPQIVLVDELAHTNAPGSRHKKRYQDIEELLRAGITVFTTVNVQHLESLNDKVAAITQISVAERIPDYIFDQASHVELIDIEPDDLIDRLNAGKIYAPERATAALSHFFTKKNLKNLREIALRRMADRMARNVDVSEQLHAEVREDVLVYVTEDSANAKVIRAAARMAEAYYGSFTAVVIEPSSGKKLEREQQEQLRSNIDLAEELGARVVILHGDDTAMLITQYCVMAGVTQVVIGGSKKAAPFMRGPHGLASRLMQLSRGAVINVVPLKDLPAQFSRQMNWSSFKPSLKDVGLATAAVLVSTLIGTVLFELGISNTICIMIYMAMSMVLATKARSFSYAFFAALGSTLAFNFFFTIPRFTFNAYGISYPTIFAFLLLSTLLVSSLAVRMNRQIASTTRRSYRTEVLLQSSRLLQQANDMQTCFSLAAQTILKLLDRPLIMYEVGDKENACNPVVYNNTNLALTQNMQETLVSASEQAIATWVAMNNEQAGATTDTLSNSSCLYLPIQHKNKVYGVAALVLVEDDDDFGPFEKNLLVMILDECGQAAEQIALQEEHRAIELRAAKDALRSNLLRTISHDLRTPLTSISGDANMLLLNGDSLSEEQKKRMYQDMSDDSAWLVGLVENLLSAARIDEDSLELEAKPELVDDIVQEALSHVNRNIKQHTLRVENDADFLMVRVDARLIVQVLINLVNNAVAHTPEASCITVKTAKIASETGKSSVQFSVIDDGPGIPDANKDRIFDLFFNGSSTDDNGMSGDYRRGMGLGLALCQSIVKAHGGELSVSDVAPHGSEFSFSLPLFDHESVLEKCHEELHLGEGK